MGVEVGVGVGAGMRVGVGVGVGMGVWEGSGKTVGLRTEVLNSSTAKFGLAIAGEFVRIGSGVRVRTGAMVGVGTVAGTGVGDSPALLPHAIKAAIDNDNKPSRLTSPTLFCIVMSLIKRLWCLFPTDSPAKLSGARPRLYSYLPMT